MDPQTDPSHPSPRPSAQESFEDFAQAQPARAAALRAEINEITRGNFRSIEFDLDPLSAFHLATALDFALSHPQFPDSGRASVDRVYEGLVERIAPQFPELGLMLATGFRNRWLGGAAPPPKHPDTVRMDWLQNAFLGGNTEAGPMIGLPGNWTTLRTEVDRAIEEGR